MTQREDHNNDEHENLVWLDFETTGTDEQGGALLELGIVVTNKDLETQVEESWVIKPYKEVPVFTVDPYVLQMHNKNGLWADCVGDLAVPLDQVVAEAQELLKKHKAVGSPMCGNTINFDRRWARAQMPELNKLFHYRNIDVSTLKNVFKMHFSNALAYVPESKEPSHRVIDDLRNSIAEYKYYLGIISTGVEAP